MTTTPRSRAGLLILAALGVVFGDIGTSPLYALRECFSGSHAIPVTPDNVLGVLSLVVWSLVNLLVAVLYNLICSRVVPEVIAEHGGKGVRTRVGHSFIKRIMAETGAVFGGEHSGHYYFRDHYNADSGLVASMIVMDQMSKAGRPLSELLAPYRRYADSGEINTEVADKQAVIERVAAAYAEGRHDRLDGLTVEFDDWWFNLRPSNTEPLLRLNVEARSEESLAEKTAEILALIRGKS